MTPEQDQRWRELSPWYTHWPFAPADCNGTWSDDGARVNQFLSRVGGADVLELSCLEGAHTYPLARACRSVTSLEGRIRNVEATLLVGEVLGVNNVTVRWCDLETEWPTWLGRFDAIFASGILYHLPDPQRLIKQCAQVSDRLFIWTHLADREEVPDGRWYTEGTSSTCGLSPQSFWPTRGRLLSWLVMAGYSVDVVAEQPDHPNGPAITLACERSA